jgi:antitoxin component of RelBE/YafQ-DinJ toxin-antitoxin module
MIEEYMKKYPIRLHVRIDEQTHEATSQLAAQLEISQAQLVRLMLRSIQEKSIKTIKDELYF